MHPVVYVHGLIGHLHLPELAVLDGRPTLSPELLGYGQWRSVAPEQIDLAGQVAHLHAVVQAAFPGQVVDLVAHSVGGVVACLYAQQYPEHVGQLVSVEGNFTLKDAFWSASVAAMPLAEVEALLAGFRADPGLWLKGAGIVPDARTQALANSWLAQQPGATLQAMARSVVSVTGAPAYEAALREVFARHPVHLLAGEQSYSGWDVPDWAHHAAAGLERLPGLGHLMMLEHPQAFAQAIIRMLRAE